MFKQDSSVANQSKVSLGDKTTADQTSIKELQSFYTKPGQSISTINDESNQARP